MEFKATNTNTLAPLVYRAIQEHGVRQPSRNGDVLRLPGVTTCTLTKPYQRVNFCEERDANPFFHLIEGLAMLAGFNSVPLMSFFAKNMASYTDDGLVYNAFYGTRARVTWGDQLDKVIKTLSKDMNSRQALVNLWDPADLDRNTKDKACNLCMIFSITPHGAVEMTSFNRSNDMIWGYVTGANVVHLSMFHEYVALALGLPTGSWHHSSANAHIYLDNPKWEKIQNLPASNMYELGATGYNIPLYYDRRAFDREVVLLMSRLLAAASTFGESPGASGFDPVITDVYNTPIINDAANMANAYMAYKDKDPDEAKSYLAQLNATDWQLACLNWINRRVPN